MKWSLPALLLAAGCATESAPAGGGNAAATSAAPGGFPADWPASFGFGRDAAPAELAALDIDARPDGKGLPAGRGSVVEGEAVYRAKCAACHGPTGIEGPNDRLVGRIPGDSFPFAESRANRARQTVGSYWPYATTLFDYINRAMPQNAPGSLGADEIYAVIAYVLYRNEIVPEDAVLDASSLAQVRMPARDRFVPDDRTGGPVVR